MNAPHNNHGFTLIEALIAMVILTVGILTLITMQTSSIKGNAKARGITIAANLSQDRIEQLLGQKYDDVKSGTETSKDGHYDTAWTVNNNILTSVKGYTALKQVQVTVTRTDFGDKRGITFNYYRQYN